MRTLTPRIPNLHLLFLPRYIDAIQSKTVHFALVNNHGHFVAELAARGVRDGGPGVVRGVLRLGHDGGHGGVTVVFPVLLECLGEHRHQHWLV